MSEHAAELSRLNKNAKGRQGAPITHELLAEIRRTGESQFKWGISVSLCVGHTCAHLYGAIIYREYAPIEDTPRCKHLPVHHHMTLKTHTRSDASSRLYLDCTVTSQR